MFEELQLGETASKFLASVFVVKVQVEGKVYPSSRFINFLNRNYELDRRHLLESFVISNPDYVKGMVAP